MRLRADGIIREKTEPFIGVFGRLRIQTGKINAGAQQPRRSPRFQPTGMQMKLLPESRCQSNGRRITGTPAGKTPQAEVHLSRQKRSGRNHNALGFVQIAEFRLHTADCIPVQQKRSNLGLLDSEIRGKFQQPLHGALISDFIALGTRRPDRGSLGPVQHSELNGRSIGNLSHCPAEGIDFAYQMTFRNAADTRVAAHLGNMIKVDGQHQSGCAKPSRGISRLAGGMSAADHDNIIIFFRHIPISFSFDNPVIYRPFPLFSSVRQLFFAIYIIPAIENGVFFLKNVLYCS